MTRSILVLICTACHKFIVAGASEPWPGTDCSSEVCKGQIQASHLLQVSRESWPSNNWRNRWKNYWEKEELQAHVFAVNSEHPTFPGPRGTAKTAVCFSGGGSRAMSAAMGQMRALESLGTLPTKVDAISSVSGGTWASSQYMYVDASSEELLGQLSSPEQLSLEALNKHIPKMGATATTSTNEIIEKSSKSDVGLRAHDFWMDTICKAILAPYNLDDSNLHLAPSQEAVKEIIARNPELATAKFAVPRADRPKAYTMNGMIIGPAGTEGTETSAVSLQMSPDWIGSPFFPNNRRAVYKRAPGVRNLFKGGPRWVGGGFVEAFAFGGKPPTSGQGGESSSPVSVGKPSPVFSLAHAVAISSAAPAEALTKTIFGGTLNPRVLYWPIKDGVSAKETYMGDGGSIDNMGLLSQLQSGVSKALVFMNTAKHLDPQSAGSESLCDAAPNADLTHTAASGLTCYFLHCGEIEGSVYKNNKVFPEDKLQPLLCEFEKLVQQGKPAVVKQTLQLQKNDWWGIAGGREVELVWFYNEKCTDFENKLPAETKAEISKGEGGAFANFPQYKTMFQNGEELTSYTRVQVNLLAAQTQYAVEQNKDLVCQVVGC